jgi:hypothetical protein
VSKANKRAVTSETIVLGPVREAPAAPTPPTITLPGVPLLHVLLERTLPGPLQALTELHANELDGLTLDGGVIHVLVGEWHAGIPISGARHFVYLHTKSDRA